MQQPTQPHIDFLTSGNQLNAIQIHGSVARESVRFANEFSDFHYLWTGDRFHEDQVSAYFELLPYEKPPMDITLMLLDPRGRRDDPANHSGIFRILCHDLQQLQQLELWLGGPSGPTAHLVSQRDKETINSNLCQPSLGWALVSKPPPDWPDSPHPFPTTPYVRPRRHAGANGRR